MRSVIGLLRMAVALPSTKRLQQIQQNLLYSRVDANPQVNLDQWTIDVFDNF